MPDTTTLSPHMQDYLTINGLRIRYQRVGAGGPLLLLHGWGSSIESMTTVIAELKKNHTVYALDLPGHGKSDLPPTAWGTTDFTNCVLEAMDRFELTSADIVAHSFGGRVAIQLASLHPERVGKLVLVDSAGVLPARPLKYKLRVGVAKVAKFFAQYGGSLGEKFRNYVYSKVASKDYMAAGALRSSLVLVVREDLSGIMPRINTPTLLVWGKEDQDTPVASAVKMQQLIPGSELVVLEHAGHFSFIDQPNQFNLLVKRFLHS